MSEEAVFIGIDMGTGGVRALAIDQRAQLLAVADAPLPASDGLRRSGLHEQSAESWWSALCSACGRLTETLTRAGVSADRLAGAAVDGTSGTVVPVDAQGRPLHAAIMYNDGRSGPEAEELNAAAGEFCARLGYRFAASFGLAKMLWFARHAPAIVERTRWFLHQADFAAGRLTGCWGVSDYSNALKSGYDLIDEGWPAWLGRFPEVLDRLPRVVAPAEFLGRVCAQAAEATGLPPGLAIFAGASDGTAGFLASGARRPGDFNTTLGTTLVFKGLSRSLCRHPEGLVYCHKLPGGLWLPGAAGNVGCEWIATLFPAEDPARMDAAAAGRLPIDVPAYPLVRRGERFPFLRPAAEGFLPPESLDPLDRYAACLQGVACVERLAYGVLDDVAGTSGGEVFSTGGGSRSDIWLQCRANLTGRPIHRPACPDSAAGSAVLAAAGALGCSVTEAAGRLVRVERTMVPDPVEASRFQTVYGRFCDELQRRGYL